MTGLAITGVGITTPLGQGKDLVQANLLRGMRAFRIMQRPGRQRAVTAFLGAEIESLHMPERVPQRLRRGLSWSAQVALATLAEAWEDARLDRVDPTRIGLIVGGSNLQQRELALTQDAYRDRVQFLRPSYGQSFMDTDIGAVCSEAFGIRGMVFTVGGASASGHLAVVQAAHAVRNDQVDVCIALGALMDISYVECQGLRAMGAMGSDRFANDPDAACRPFDRLHDGFIFGENCGAVVIERDNVHRAPPYAFVRGWSYQVEGHRSPDPSLAGEIRAIESALQMAGLDARHIDYVNPHGTGSVIGDETEMQALQACGLGGTPINATKSLLGHGLSAAGTVEVVATLLQMRAGQLHPTANLDDPLDASFAWVKGRAQSHRVRHALNASFGFGGINSALCLSNSLH